MPAIKLEYPFEHDGTTYTEIEVDNPTLGDIRYAQNLAKSCDDAIEASVLTIVRFSGWSEGAVDKLRQRDLERVMESFAPLSPGPEPTAGAAAPSVDGAGSSPAAGATSETGGATTQS